MVEVQGKSVETHFGKKSSAVKALTSANDIPSHWKIAELFSSFPEKSGCQGDEALFIRAGHP